MKPLVSVLIPAFNAQEWIADTLRSASEQTWSRKEIIVVDDGSTDQTLTIARRFESECTRVVTQRNQGAAAARNRALSLCQGDYIQWLDADDLLAPDKIACQVEALDGCPSERTLLSSAWARFMYRYYRADFVPDALWSDLSPAEFFLRKVGQNLLMPNASWLVSRELTHAAGPWDNSQLVDDDGEYFCRVLLASDGIRFVPEARMCYRVTPNSHSLIGGMPRKLDSQWRSMQLHIRHLQSLEDSPRTRSACVHFLQFNLNYFYPERPDIVRQAERLAQALGGELRIPQLSWKYSWIAPLFGSVSAKHVQLRARSFKVSLARCWDHALFRVENWSEWRGPRAQRAMRSGTGPA